jgi:hypothetical protein
VNAALRTDGALRTWDCRRLVLMCPACGADCLLPLSCPEYRPDAGAEVVFRRPMATCSRCGQLVVANVIARQRLPKSL